MTRQTARPITGPEVENIRKLLWLRTLVVAREPTDHPVGNGAEKQDGDEPHWDDVAEDLGQEVDRDAVEAVAALVHEDLALADEEVNG